MKNILLPFLVGPKHTWQTIRNSSSRMIDKNRILFQITFRMKIIIIFKDSEKENYQSLWTIRLRIRLSLFQIHMILYVNFMYIYTSFFISKLNITYLYEKEKTQLYFLTILYYVYRMTSIYLYIITLCEIIY